MDKIKVITVNSEGTDLESEFEIWYKEFLDIDITIKHIKHIKTPSNLIIIITYVETKIPEPFNDLKL